MSARDAHLADVLCHCGGDDRGHPLADERCTETVKAGTYAPAPHPSVVGELGGMRAQVTHGTCPECKRRTRVVRIETRVHTPGMNTSRPGALAQIAPGMAPHRHAGTDCPGAGRVPAETKYKPGRVLAELKRELGANAVVA